MGPPTRKGSRNKKAKAAVAAAASSERVQASIDKVLSDVSSNSTLRNQENEARCAALMEKTDKKLELEKAMVAGKK